MQKTFIPPIKGGAILFTIEVTGNLLLVVREPSAAQYSGGPPAFHLSGAQGT